MKLLWAVPKTHNVQAIVNSLQYARPDDEIKIYFLGEPNPPDVTSFVPDVLLYIGAISGPRMLTIDSLKKIREKTKIVNLIVNGCDKGTHSWIQEQIDQDAVDLLVGIDGTDEFPHRSSDLVLWPPIDPRPFLLDCPKDILVGCTHEVNVIRQSYLTKLGSLISAPIRDTQWGGYQKYADFMKRCKIWLNLNFSEGMMDVRTINQKIIEAGYAGCIFLEKRGGFANRFFQPDIDYYEYETVDDIKYAIYCLKDSIGGAAINLHYKIKDHYNPIIFWNRVFDRLAECA